jgi:predicted RNA-binding protein with RPS1 domain
MPLGLSCGSLRSTLKGRELTGIETGPSAEENSTSEATLNSPPNAASPAGPVAASTDADSGSAGVDPSGEGEAERPKILIGSQRDPAAYRVRPKRDWTPVEDEDQKKAEAGSGGDKGRQERHGGRGSHDRQGAGTPQLTAPSQAPQNQGTTPPQGIVPPVAATQVVVPPVSAAPLLPEPAPLEPLFPEPVLRDPIDDDVTPVVPGRRQKLNSTMEAELERAMAGLSLDDLMTGGESNRSQEILEPESRHKGRVVAVRRDEIFVELGGRQQGCLSARSLETWPQPGETIEVIVQKFNAEEGLYDLTLPGASVELGNWDSVHEGMTIDVQVTGHNTGGLECESNHIRGFIPVSQISLYRVEDLAQFVGQRFACLITDANPARKNLVLSRRAILEREQEEKKEAFLAALAPGQVYEGTVRKLMDFGAFVELGHGVDGLLHVSQLSWGRVKHPSDVLQEGQPVRVRIDKFDRESGRIGLSYREMIENPWTAAATKYPHNAIVRGKVTRLMEFGAFVEIEPGIEGLIHISELAHKRIFRASDVVNEGDEVEVLVLSVNPEAQRMSLSIKGLSKPEPTKKEKEEAREAELPAEVAKPRRVSNVPLKGGLGKPSGGESLGLNW